MSLDISLTNKRTGESRDMNWLRNPFGLCNWAEANVAYATSSADQKVRTERRTLYYVCNHWNYQKSGNVNRKLFKDVVEDYSKTIESLERGYYFFNVATLLQFVVPNLRDLPLVSGFPEVTRIKDSVFTDKGEYGIPMEYFTAPAFHLSRPTLKQYKEWFSQLAEFAELLQDQEWTFYCSN